MYLYFGLHYGLYTEIMPTSNYKQIRVSITLEVTTQHRNRDQRENECSTECGDPRRRHTGDWGRGKCVGVRSNLSFAGQWRLPGQTDFTLIVNPDHEFK